MVLVGQIMCLWSCSMVSAGHNLTHFPSSNSNASSSFLTYAEGEGKDIGHWTHLGNQTIYVWGLLLGSLRWWTLLIDLLVSKVFFGTCFIKALQSAWEDMKSGNSCISDILSLNCNLSSGSICYLWSHVHLLLQCLDDWPNHVIHVPILRTFVECSVTKERKSWKKQMQNEKKITLFMLF